MTYSGSLRSKMATQSSECALHEKDTKISASLIFMYGCALLKIGRKEALWELQSGVDRSEVSANGIVMVTELTLAKREVRMLFGVATGLGCWVAGWCQERSIDNHVASDAQHCVDPECQGVEQRRVLRAIGCAMVWSVALLELWGAGRSSHHRSLAEMPSIIISVLVSTVVTLGWGVRDEGYVTSMRWFWWNTLRAFCVLLMTWAEIEG